jgi:hypothetical protein
MNDNPELAPVLDLYVNRSTTVLQSPWSLDAGVRIGYPFLNPKKAFAISNLVPGIRTNHFFFLNSGQYAPFGLSSPAFRALCKPSMTTYSFHLTQPCPNSVRPNLESKTK